MGLRAIGRSAKMYLVDVEGSSKYGLIGNLLQMLKPSLSAKSIDLEEICKVLAVLAKRLQELVLDNGRVKLICMLK